MVRIKLINAEPVHAAVVKYKTPVAKIPENMGKAFGSVASYLESKHLAPSAMPFSMYLSMSPDNDGEWEVISGMPVDAEITKENDVEPFDLPAGKVAVATHIGPYDTLEKTYSKVDHWIKKHHLKPAGMMWEYYFNGPNSEPDPSKWRTDIYWPVTT